MENVVEVSDLSVLNKVESENKDHQENAVDIFGLLIPELRSHLLKYLCSERHILLKMSLVCKSWNSIISNSTDFTNQYLLTNKIFSFIHDEKKKSDFFTDIVASQRHYDSFKITRTFMIELLNQVPGKCWKYGELKNLTFKDKVHLISFLNTLSPTMEDISLKSIYIIDSENPLNDLPSDNEPEFKELRKLKIGIVPHVILRLFVKHHPKLTNVEIGKFMPYTDTILELLRLNPQIDEITVNDEIYNLTKTQNLEFLNLKLKALVIKIDSFHCGPWASLNQSYQITARSENFKKFLIAQGKTLKKLACYNVYDMSTTILELWNDMPELQTLLIQNELWEPSYIKPDNQTNIRVNPKLKELTLAIHFKSQEINYLKEILSRTPNISNLFVRRLSKEIVTYVAYNLRHLKKIQCQVIEDGIEVYEQLKQAPGNINRDITLVNGRAYF